MPNDFWKTPGPKPPGEPVIWFIRGTVDCELGAAYGIGTFYEGDPSDPLRWDMVDGYALVSDLPALPPALRLVP